MKPVKNFFLAMLFVSATAVSTTAGVQDTPGYVEPPPPPRQMATISDGSTSGSSTDQVDDTADTSDYLFLEALVALLSVY